MPDRPGRRLTSNNEGRANSTLRLFFAIWPDSAAREQMAELVRRLELESLCDGRKTRIENIHLTLVFVGEVDRDRLDALGDVAARTGELGLASFDLVFDSVRYWKHNQIVYAAASQVPPELTRLVSHLQLAVAAAGFGLEDRPYIPHITLMKRASCRNLPELPEPVVWQIKEWMLVKSEQTSGGSVYSPVRRWLLGARAD